jgi:TetR/AcrR family transcriptional repressor of nem operon
MKQKILEVAEQMVQDRGLNAVSFQDLADAVGLRKPSVFHHFKNKEELTLALIDRCTTKHGPQYAKVIASDNSAPQKLRLIAKIFEDGLINRRPCLMAALGAGINTMPVNAVEELHTSAQAAVERFAEVFEQGRRDGTLTFEGESELAAMSFFAMLQGLQILARAKNDSSAFSKAASTYIDSLAK